MSRREDILSAAARTIARKGVQGATVHEIARAAGIAAGTVYLYFATKAEIIVALMDKLAQGLDEDLEKAAKAKSDQAVWKFLQARAERLQSSAGVLPALVGQAASDSKLAGELRRRVFDPHREALRKLLRRAGVRGRGALAVVEAMLWWAAGMAPIHGQPMDARQLARAVSKCVR